MRNNCTPCRCNRIIWLIQHIAGKVCENKCTDLENRLPGLIEEEVKKYITGSSLKGIHAQLYGKRDEQTIIPNNGIVPFKIVINNLSDITLSDGEFIIPKTGNYLINWTVPAPSGDDSFIDFSISVNGIPKAQGGGMWKESPVESSAIIALEAGDIISLKNISGQEVRLQSIPSGLRPTAIIFQANIVISYLD